MIAHFVTAPFAISETDLISLSLPHQAG
jgi:hypothetical protein